MKNGSVLMVIDVQRVYMEPDPMVTSDGDDLVPKCKDLIDRAREAEVPVFFVQHISDNQPDDPALTCVHPALDPADGEPIVQKHFGSAFFKTDLEQQLQRLGAKTLYISGLATFGCVNATVMCALCKGYDARVIENAHGSPEQPQTSAADMIRIFNESWARAGATLVCAEDVVF